jgi:riboflavin biosynthesis pyrimidine reductase
MGAWGTGPFENDDAADWAYELEEAADLSPVRQALSATLDTDGYLEVPEGACAVAAAAVVAATFDGDVRGFPEQVVEWIVDHPDAAGREDARLAVDALERVTSEESELRQLAVEGGGGAAWVRAMETLRVRLVRAIGD